MGIAHHGNYLTWFEIGRTDLCREVGWSYRDIEASGFLLVVAEVTCRYLLPYRYDDEVVIATTVGEASRRLLRFEYELRDPEGSLHARGSTTHVWVDAGNRRPVTAPPSITAAFRAAS